MFFTSAKVEKFPEPLRGTVEKTIAPNQRGRVYFLATYWPAQFYQPECKVTVVADEPVSIVGIQGITLLVMPLGSNS